MNVDTLPAIAVALLLAPLLPGIVNRVKAFFAGRRGRPLVQNYRDLRRLLSRGTVYSRSTTWIFQVAPVIGLLVALAGLTLVPLNGRPALFSFEGDLILFIYLLALARVFIVLAALDTGSAFEGMGAAREVFFAALSEPVLILGLVTLALQAGEPSLSAPGASVRGIPGVTSILVAGSLFIVLLAESSRLPFDDPNTHLELTMIHEVMVLDHGGPDLGIIQYAHNLRLWILGSLLMAVLIPRGSNPVLNFLLPLAGLFALAVVIGILESIMARLRFKLVPQLLMGAGALAALGLVLLMVWRT